MACLFCACRLSVTKPLVDLFACHHIRPIWLFGYQPRQQDEQSTNPFRRRSHLATLMSEAEHIGHQTESHMHTWNCLTIYIYIMDVTQIALITC